MKMEIHHNIVALSSEPLANVSIEMLKEKLRRCNDESTLACVFADVFNEAGWLMDDLDDDDCSEDLKQEFYRWEEFETSLRTAIFNILKKEPDWQKHQMDLTDEGYYWKLIPFMERNGYSGRDGWWIKNE